MKGHAEKKRVQREMCARQRGHYKATRMREADGESSAKSFIRVRSSFQQKRHILVSWSRLTTLRKKRRGDGESE